MWTALQVFGCALVVAGVALVYVPASLIVGGALVFGVGYLVER